jgi:integrative and conjugative element protein (TIGR02256 family)
MSSRWSGRPPAVPDIIYIARSVLHLMEQEAHRHSHAALGENETGGILIGRRLEAPQSVRMLIAAATGPGEGALHHLAEFNYDVDYVNQKLNEYRASYPTMDYIGTWHKHPLDYPTFSAGDVNTAHHLFQDPSYKMAEIINPIVWLDGDDFTIRYYYMSRAMATQGQPFVEIPAESIQVIDDDDSLIQRELCIGEDFHRLLEGGYRVTIKQEADEYFFTVSTASLPDVVIYLVTSEDYPHSPPVVLVEQDGHEIAGDDGGVVEHWNEHNEHNERHYLVEIVEHEVEYLTTSDDQQPPPPAPPPERHTRPSAPADDDGHGSAAPAAGIPAAPATTQKSALPFIAAGVVVVVLLLIFVVTSNTGNNNAATTPPTSGTTAALSSGSDAAVPPDAITIRGSGGTIDRELTFTATISDTTTTTPVTYRWQASGQADTIEHSGALSDTITLQWDTPGTHSITLTASNSAGAATATHTVNIYRGDE